MILITQIAATLFMTGLIWFVQIVHYPLYNEVGPDHFTRYEEQHNRLTTWVVGPVMLIELATALALIRWSPADSGSLSWIAAGLLAVIWLSTAFLQVPAHNSLTRAFSDEAWQTLVRTNWIRTIAWTTRSAILLSLLSKGGSYS